MAWLRKPSKLARLVSKVEKRILKSRAKREAEKVARAAWDWMRRQIYVRDDGKCRVCGRVVHLQHANPLRIAHVHHVIYRSAGGPDETWNLCLLCCYCHDAEHVQKTLDINGNADLCLSIDVRHPESFRVLEVKESPCPSR